MYNRVTKVLYLNETKIEEDMVNDSILTVCDNADATQVFLRKKYSLDIKSNRDFEPELVFEDVCPITGNRVVIKDKFEMNYTLDYHKPDSTFVCYYQLLRTCQTYMLLEYRQKIDIKYFTGLLIDCEDGKCKYDERNLLDRKIYCTKCHGKIADNLEFLRYIQPVSIMCSEIADKLADSSDLISDKVHDPYVMCHYYDYYINNVDKADVLRNAVTHLGILEGNMYKAQELNSKSHIEMEVASYRDELIAKRTKIVNACSHAVATSVSAITKYMEEMNIVPIKLPINTEVLIATINKIDKAKKDKQIAEIQRKKQERDLIRQQLLQEQKRTEQEMLMRKQHTDNLLKSLEREDEENNAEIQQLQK